MFITGKKMEVGDALRTQAEDRLRGLCKKYDLTPLEATVTFSKEGSPHHPMTHCAIEMHLGQGIHVRVSEETDDAHLCLEQATETFEKQLRRYKKKLIDHMKKRDVPHTKAPASQYVINASEGGEVEDNPLIIAESLTEVPTLTVAEAVMHLDLSNTPVILFHNATHKGLHVVYRRDDGNIGWIAPH